MNKEHLKMVQEIAGLSMDEASEKPIHDSVVSNDTIRMLNTEKEVFIEGKSMRHCLFVNYLDRIKEKRYLAFHMELPERCTIGVKINADGRPTLDQVHRECNQRLKENKTLEIIKTFIQDNLNRLSELMMPEVYLTEAVQDFDLPF